MKQNEMVHPNNEVRLKVECKISNNLLKGYFPSISHQFTDQFTVPAIPVAGLCKQMAIET